MQDKWYIPFAVFVMTFGPGIIVAILLYLPKENSRTIKTGTNHMGFRKDN